MSRLRIELEIASADTAVPPQSDFNRWATAAAEQVRPGERLLVHIRVTDEAEITTLNTRYRDKAAPTNVLSFPMDAPLEEGVLLLGDLVMCAAVIEREAAEQQKLPGHHWAHMTVHGTLHLLGLDHLEDEEAEHMEACERAILAGFGIPDPYRPTDNDSPEAAA